MHVLKSIILAIKWVFISWLDTVYMVSNITSKTTVNILSMHYLYKIMHIYIEIFYTSKIYTNINMIALDMNNRFNVLFTFL